MGIEEVLVHNESGCVVAMVLQKFPMIVGVGQSNKFHLQPVADEAQEDVFVHVVVLGIGRCNRQVIYDVGSDDLGESTSVRARPNIRQLLKRQVEFSSRSSVDSIT